MKIVSYSSIFRNSICFYYLLNSVNILKSCTLHILIGHRQVDIQFCSGGGGNINCFYSMYAYKYWWCGFFLFKKLKRGAKKTTFFYIAISAHLLSNTLLFFFFLNWKCLTIQMLKTGIFGTFIQSKLKITESNVIVCVCWNYVRFICILNLKRKNK